MADENQDELLSISRKDLHDLLKLARYAYGKNILLWEGADRTNEVLDTAHGLVYPRYARLKKEQADGPNT